MQNYAIAKKAFLAKRIKLYDKLSAELSISTEFRYFMLSSTRVPITERSVEIIQLLRSTIKLLETSLLADLELHCTKSTNIEETKK